MSEVIELIALRRVHDGDVVLVGGQWLDHEHPVASYLPDALVELVRTGLIVVAIADDATSTLRAALTTAGTARYQELLEDGRFPRDTAARSA